MRKVLAAGLLVTLSTGCVQQRVSPVGTNGSAIKPLGATAIPSTLLGLKVTQENVSKALSAARSTYVKDLSLYSLRKGKLLEATLQVARIDTSKASYAPNFQATVAQAVGGSIPREARLGDQRVYLVRGTRQRIAVWFSKEFMFVMSIRDDFAEPRTLLRKALAITPVIP